MVRGDFVTTYSVAPRATWLQLPDRSLARLVSRLYEDTRSIPVATEQALLQRLGNPTWFEWSPA